MDIDAADRAWAAAAAEQPREDWNDDEHEYTAEDIRLWEEAEAHQKAERERELEISWLGKGVGKGDRGGKAKGKGKGAAGKTGKGAGTSDPTKITFLWCNKVGYFKRDCKELAKHKLDRDAVRARKGDHTPFVLRPRGQTPVRWAGSLGRPS